MSKIYEGFRLPRKYGVRENMKSEYTKYLSRDNDEKFILNLKPTNLMIMNCNK